MLNRKTVSNLNNADLSNAKGGTEDTYTQDPCDTIMTCRRICCYTFFCMTDPNTDWCWTVQFCTE